MQDDDYKRGPVMRLPKVDPLSDYDPSDWSWRGADGIKAVKKDAPRYTYSQSPKKVNPKTEEVQARRFRVRALAAKGMCAMDIANEMGIFESTVRKDATVMGLILPRSPNRNGGAQ